MYRILDVHLLLYWCARSQGRLNRTERTIFHWSINRDLDRVIHITQHNVQSQLNWPTDMLIDSEANSVIICDSGNGRVVQYSHEQSTNTGGRIQIIIENIACFGLAIDHQGYLYLSDENKHEVKRFGREDTTDRIVAGGHGQGSRLKQLNTPHYIFINREQSIYVSDYANQRVMKWMKDAIEDVVVAGGKEKEMI
jgi:hypothetical protein